MMKLYEKHQNAIDVMPPRLLMDGADSFRFNQFLAKSIRYQMRRMNVSEMRNHLDH